MLDRRSLLASLAACAVLPTPALAGSPGPNVSVRRYGAHFLVDGWVLTHEDLERLGIDAR